jgi:CheY-like chemotaxis protein
MDIRPEVAVSVTKRILVIEDNPDAAEALALLLSSAGHQVETALTGVAGVEIARTFRPDLVLCDIWLAGDLDGLAVARQLRAEPGTCEAALVALSGISDPGDQASALDAGFDQFLIKPADPDRILEIAANPRASV